MKKKAVILEKHSGLFYLLSPRRQCRSSGGKMTRTKPDEARRRESWRGEEFRAQPNHSRHPGYHWRKRCGHRVQSPHLAQMPQCRLSLRHSSGFSETIQVSYLLRMGIPPPLPPPSGCYVGTNKVICA